MKDRIKEFIDYKGISAGELADLLNVQRSNISHILNVHKIKVPVPLNNNMSFPFTHSTKSC